MKSVQRTAVETPKSTLLTILAIVVGVLDLFISFSPSLELPSKTIALVSFIGGAIIFIINTILNNKKTTTS